jgi:fatty acid amide hydrolase 2
VRRLRVAGAIPLGVTNTSELCMWMESDNRVYGRTNNPYDPSRIVGGSSGGEAAIISAAGSAFGLGSDIGGSIRGPCFFNGIFGHKATGGLVPNSGQYPIAQNEARRFLATGPMVKKAEDLYPILKILAGPDGEDGGCSSELLLGDPASVELRGMTVLDVRGNGVMPVTDDLLDAQERAARALEQRGMKVRSASFHRLRHQFDIWSAMMTRAREDPFGSMLGQGRPIRPLIELAKAAFGRSDHMVISSIIALVDPLPGLVPGLADKVIGAGQKLRREILSELGDDGVLLYPTYSCPAPKHGTPVLRTLLLELPFAHQGIWNVLEMPATEVPLGLNSEGLPLGCQVVSKHGNDHVTIAVALELERALGGWVPPKIAAEADSAVARAAS